MFILSIYEATRLDCKSFIGTRRKHTTAFLSRSRQSSYLRSIYQSLWLDRLSQNEAEWRPVPYPPTPICCLEYIATPTN